MAMKARKPLFYRDGRLTRGLLKNGNYRKALSTQSLKKINEMNNYVYTEAPKVNQRQIRSSVG